MDIIRLENICKSYDGENKVICNLDLSIHRGEMVALIGPSGCGKTTLLKMINGLVIPDTGYLTVSGKLLSDWNLTELRRRTGYVVQQTALFPHMDVYRNITYVLDLQGKDDREKRDRAEEIITMMGMDKSFLGRFPRELSGGQKQRIGVARALAADPEIILMDEPFGAVDGITRVSLQDELLSLQKRLGKTVVFVTHDVEEAVKLGDRTAVLNEGRLEQIGSREEIVFSPASDFVRRIFGLKNFTAYLDTVTAGSVSEPIEGIADPLLVQDSVSVAESDSALAALKKLFDSGQEKIITVSSSGKPTGLFSLAGSRRTIGQKKEQQ